MQQIKQENSETCDETQSRRIAACIKLYGLAGPQNFICLGRGFLDPLDQWITDLLFQRCRSKHLTFKF